MDNLYQVWIDRYDTLDQAEIDKMTKEVAGMENPPLISIVVPIYNPPSKWLRRMIDSVREQIYPHWELCLADDLSTESHVRTELERAAQSDDRIKVVFRSENGHISAASNSALEIATGDFIALLDHDDELPTHALFHTATEILKHPNTDVFFSDEDKIDIHGQRSDPYFKPDFNYDLLLSQNCISHLGIYRASKLKEIGGFRIGMEGSQDWDLFFRVLETSSPDRIKHIPRILYHWRQIPGSTSIGSDEKPYAGEAGRKAVGDHLERIGLKQDSALPCYDLFVRVERGLPEPAPAVTLIMPTRNMVSLLRVAVTSILEKTEYPNFEILIVDNDSDDPETLSYLESLSTDSRIRIHKISGEFNYSKLNNEAVRHVENPVICLVNNDIEVLNGNWLREMVSQALRPDIGAVGACLLYPDGRIQHAGAVIGMVSGAGHPFRGASNAMKTHGVRAALIQNFSAITAACLVVEKEIYEKVGGLDEGEFRVGLNDIDFCLKLIDSGLCNLYTPFAELLHHESASRADMERTSAGAERAAGENAALARKWPRFFESDPCWNPNLSLDTEHGDLAFPPRQRD
ncbi:MAG: glycosyltransferase family 2 protein [Verrucomicrobiales bacterium]